MSRNNERVDLVPTRSEIEVIVMNLQVSGIHGEQECC